MKKIYLLCFVLIICTCAAVTSGLSQSPAEETTVQVAAPPAAPQPYVPPVKDQIKRYIDTRLGKKVVKEHHLKVHQNGTRCDLCHNAQNPTSPADDECCFRCHGSAAQVAQLTAKLEKNPHDSPHYGTGASCTACHKEHEDSVVLCASCHLFKYENLK